MANIRIVKDNTMPPTDCLWRKVNAAGEVEGLYAWNGYRWKLIEEADSSSGKVIYVDENGDEYQVGSIEVSADREGIVNLIDKDGNNLTTLITEEHLNQIINNLESDLYWEEDSSLLV